MNSPLDTATNQWLAEYGPLLTRAAVRAERDRIRRIINKHALTGADLSYWFDRERILERPTTSAAV